MVIIQSPSEIQNYIDKPLTPVLPELFFENDDFILSNRSIPTSL